MNFFFFKNANNWILGLVFSFLICQVGVGQEINWKDFPTLPDKEGFAGMFAGVSGEKLIVAGGANFPDQRPWEGGEKIWYNRIFILDAPDGEWTLADQTLPLPLGYGVSVSFENTVLVIGGSNREGHSARVFGLRVDQGTVMVEEDFPDLPHPLANMSGVLVDGVVMVVGGQISPEGLAEDSFWLLDLKRPIKDQHWISGPTFPGKPHVQAVAAVHGKDFYVFSGFHLTEAAAGGWERHLLVDAYRYKYEENPIYGVWEKLPDLPRGVAAAPSPAFNFGTSHLVIAGGLEAGTLKHTDPSSHPGFWDTMIGFNVKSGAWSEMGDMPLGYSRVTAPSVYWKKHWIVPSGEKRPGVRSPEVFAITQQSEFGWANWTSLGLYLLVMLGIGIYFSKRAKTTENYFLAGRKIPWWAAGLSIYGTQLSAITFMAVPAVVFATDWRLMVGLVMILLIVPIIVTFYLPFFRRVNIHTAYQYLERRFDRNVRLLGSITFILMQLARMGVVLYLPAIAISSVTGMEILVCIAIMGVFSTLYTVLGGMEAVIWTDVIQVLVLLGGALAGLVIALTQIDGGLSQVVEIGLAQDKFRVFEWGWDYRHLVFWVTLVGFFFLNIISYTSDQVVIQRYLTVRTEREAAKSLWTNGLLTIPGILLFFGLGTVLYVFYLTNPQKIGSTNPEELLPYFIVAELPVGVAGLVIAGIFAASMSSLDSSMNSITTAYITDIHRYFRPSWGDVQFLRLAKWLTVVIGLIGTLSAVWIAVANIGFIFDLFQKLMGMIGGSLAGVFILGIFTHRANARGALAGILTGTIVTLFVSRYTDVNGYLYGAIGVITCVVIGYMASFVWPMSASHPDGNTYKTLVDKK